MSNEDKVMDLESQYNSIINMNNDIEQKKKEIESLEKEIEKEQYAYFEKLTKSWEYWEDFVKWKAQEELRDYHVFHYHGNVWVNHEEHKVITISHSLLGVFIWNITDEIKEYRTA